MRRIGIGAGCGFLRLGIVRDAYFLPPVTEQRDAIVAAGCDDIREDTGSDFVADRRIQRLLFQLSPGDEAVVFALGVISRPQGRVAHVLRDLLEAGVTLRIARPNEQKVLDSDPSAVEVISLLAEHERERGAAQRKSVHHGGSRNALSKYQVEYARKMYADGESLRSIGLLFQLSPNHVLDVVSPPRTNGADAES